MRTLTLILALLAILGRSTPTGEFYTPIEREIEGWCIRIDPRLEQEPNCELGAQALARLRWDLEGIKLRIPQKRLAELQTIGIWVELDNPHVTTMQYHPDRKWLISKNMDPRLEHWVHIPRAARLIDKKLFHEQPCVIIHELAHGFHDQILSFNYKPIIAAYKASMEAGSYGKVLHGSGRQRTHYSASNYREYFAEGCEAYFGRNDFYPFVRVELKKHDPTLYALMEEIWGQDLPLRSP